MRETVTRIRNLFAICSVWLVCALVSGDYGFGLQAQETSDLLPPPISNSPFTMACAEADEDGNLLIIKSSATYSVEKTDEKTESSEGEASDSDEKESDESDESEGAKADDDEAEDSDADEAESDEEEVTMVTQSYTVQIPYTETIEVDGRMVTVTRMRTETRRRMVPVTGRRVAGKGQKPVHYTITVPYMEQVVGSDGRVKSIVRRRMETRVAMVGEDEALVRKLVPVVFRVDPAKLQFFSLDGEALDPDEVLQSVAERQPIVLIEDPKSIDDYSREIFSQGTILVVDKDNVIESSLVQPDEDAGDE